MTKDFNVEHRMEAVEGKLDRIIDKMEALIRLEERHDGTVKRVDRIDGRLDRHAERIGVLEAAAAVGDKAVGNLERAAWLVASAVVGFLAYVLRGFWT